MDLFATWWVWGLGAVVLLVLEILAPGFIFLGFGVGATAIALFLAFGLLSVSLPTLLLMFAVISLLSWVAMRQVFGVRKSQVKKWDIDINDDV